MLWKTNSLWSFGPRDFKIRRQDISSSLGPVRVTNIQTEGGGLLNDEWVSLLVVFGPQAIHPDKFENASFWVACLDSNRNLEDVEISEQRSALIYHIVGVWVAPEVRRRGVAKRMVEGAIDAIKQEGQQKRASTAICTIGVQDTAMAVQNLYQACGFSKVAEDCYKGHGERSIRDFVMRQDIETNAVEAG